MNAGPSGAESVVGAAEQDDLASMAGTTRPAANRVLQRAAESGIVAMSRGHVEVLDPARLRRRCGWRFPVRGARFCTQANVAEGAIRTDRS